MLESTFRWCRKCGFGGTAGSSRPRARRRSVADPLWMWVSLIWVSDLLVSCRVEVGGEDGPDGVGAERWTARVACWTSPARQGRGKVVSYFVPETVHVSLQHAAHHPLVLTGDV